MIVGILVIHPRLLIFGGQVYLPNSNSLKAKRQILLSIKSRLKNKFNISISGLGLLRLIRSLPASLLRSWRATDRQAGGQVDSWKESQTGISCISNSGQYVDKELSYISERVKSYPNEEIIGYSTEKI